MAELVNQVQLRTTFEAAATITAGRFVKLDTNGKAVVATANDKAVGVLEKGHPAEAVGEFISVATDGIVVIETGGAVNPGVLVGSNATGKAVSLTIDASTLPTAINGVALDKSTGDGQFIRIRLM